MGDRYWVPHDELAYAPGTLAGTSGRFTLFKIQDKDKTLDARVPTDRVKELDIVKEPQLLGVEDVCSLEVVNQAALLHTLRVRYSKDLIYTRVGRILIAANPFQWLPIFGPTVIQKYHSAPDSMDLPAHIYAIGLDAVNGLRQGTSRSQAILISGESGAGKTECTKLVLNYVGDVLGGGGGAEGQTTITDNIMQTNPVLESFGNAMTLRNNNSSRFGKWLQILVNGQAEIQGCSVTDYLLELTRVTSPGAKERGYHVFFQLTRHRSDPFLKPLGIEGPEKYSYIKDCQHTAPGIDDGEFFADMREAFVGLGFEEQTQLNIFKLVMGILTTGNMDFKDGANEAAEFVSDEPAIKAAELLGIPPETFKKPMIIRKIVIGRECTEANRNEVQARAARDSLARLMYGRLFKWLIERINVKLGSAAGGSQFLGVLDIAGFESFEVNSLEQLFINLSNEHLQQHFNTFIFKMELADYAVEGIDASTFNFSDNKDIIDLLDSKGSILAILDEEMAIPKSTDQTFCSKVFKAHDKHKRLIAPKFQGAVSFGIHHFAGRVNYDCKGFMEKNVDKPPDEAVELLQSSSNALVKEIGDKLAKEAADSAVAARGNKKVKSVSSSFRASLAELIKKMQEADPHFIRCLKPNQEKVAKKFASPVALQQLIASGVYEALRIRQSGYSSRVAFKDFVYRYKIIPPKAVQEQVAGKSAKGDDKERVRILFEALKASLNSSGEYQEGAMVIGKTKVFCRAHAVSALEQHRDLSISCFVMDMQRLARGFLARNMVKNFHKVIDELKAWSASNSFYTTKGQQATAMHKLKTIEAVEKEVHRLDALLLRARNWSLALTGKHEAEKVQHRMKNEVATIRHVKEMGESATVMDIEAVLARFADLELPDMPEVTALRAREAKLKKQVPVINSMRNGIKEHDIEVLEAALAEVKQLGLSLHPEEWMHGCDGQALTDQCYETIQQLKAKQKVDKVRQDLNAANDQKMQQELGDHRSKQERLDAAGPSRRNKRATITGLSLDRQGQILEDLRRAIAEYDSAGLQSALSDCVDHAMVSPEVSEGTQMFGDLQKEAYIEEHLRSQVATCKDKPPKSVGKGDLKSLQNLVSQAKKLNVAEDTLAEVQPLMQDILRTRARHTIRASIFHHVDLAELNLAEGGFNDLSTFPRLKKNWTGHKVAFRDRHIESHDDMLSHSTHMIKEALTEVPTDKERLCLQIFASIMGWMHDRPMGMKLTPAFATELVAQVEEEHEYIADEVFVMLMKQLTNNPSHRSVDLGWKLMLLLCQHVKPSEDLDDFLRAFLMKAFNEKGEHMENVNSLAKQCIADLNLRPDEVAEHHTTETVPVKIMLIDDSWRRLRAPPFCTLGELRNRLCEQLRISSVDDFTLFQHTEGLDMDRFVPEKAQIGILQEKWAKLKQATGRTSHLIFKRQFLRPSEHLHPGDLMHASLTYRQALWDYHRYPVSEETLAIAQVAATIVFAEFAHYESFLKMKRLADPGVLEHLIPTVSLRDQSRQQWASTITTAYTHLESVLDHDEPRLQKMARVVALLQRMKLFGCHCYMGQQLDHLPADRALPDSPKQACLLNPKARKANYWVCLNQLGVRFVTVDSRPGNSFQRGFVFQEEAVDRILAWSPKGKLVTMVVSGVNQETRDRRPMTIVLESAAAIDICFCLHVSYSRLKR